MCKILQGKIKDIYLIQYLWTLKIISRFNDYHQHYNLVPCFQYRKRKNYFPYHKSFMNLGKSVSHYIKSSCHFSYFFLFAILTPFTKYETGEEMKILKKYPGLRNTII